MQVQTCLSDVVSFIFNQVSVDYERTGTCLLMYTCNIQLILSKTVTGLVQNSERQ